MTISFLGWWFGVSVLLWGWVRVMAYLLDWIESRRQRQILRQPLTFEPRRRATDRRIVATRTRFSATGTETETTFALSEAEERRIYQSALSITQGRIQ